MTSLTLSRITAVALATLATCAGTAALAQNDTLGWYGGANIGRTSATIDDPRIRSGLAAGGLTTNSISDRDRDTGYKVFGGYQINRNFAVEGGYFDLGKFGYTANTTPAGSLSGDMRVKGLNLDLVGTLPLSERFSAFGRVGLNYAHTRDNFSGTGAVRVGNANPSAHGTNYKMGVGLQYALSDAWSVRGELERYRVKDGVGNRGHIDMASLGLVYRFGRKVQTPVAQSAYVPVAAAPAPAVAMPTPAPAPIAAPPRTEKYTLSATELFGFDSATLQGNQQKLDDVATALRSSGAQGNVVITGYTDRLGSEAYNQKLSERRAAAVKTYLSGKGVDATRLSAQGKGETNPVVTCTDTRQAQLIKCLEPNRRVEVENFTVERRLP
ncbi:MAG: OmpA/MotB domain protein [Polaromonas sp.]|nr:OmpA/MotB domain protein [Polaromonas sp.]